MIYSLTFKGLITLIHVQTDTCTLSHIGSDYIGNIYYKYITGLLIWSIKLYIKMHVMIFI